MPWLASASGSSRERDACCCLATSLQRVVQRLVGHLDAGAIGALHLQFLQHQAVEHLLAQHVLRAAGRASARAAAR